MEEIDYYDKLSTLRAILTDTSPLIKEELLRQIGELNRIANSLLSERDALKKQLDQALRENDLAFVAYCSTRHDLEEELFKNGKIDRVLTVQQIAATYRDSEWVRKIFPEGV